MADVKLNSLAQKTNANAAAILVKDSATQNAGAEGWITKAQLNQIIRDEIKAQMSAITSGTPDVPVLDGSTLKYMTLANFAKVAGEQREEIPSNSDLDDYILPSVFYVESTSIAQTINNMPEISGGRLEVKPVWNTSVYQIYFSFTLNIYYRRYYRTAGSSWSAWRKVNVTEQ